MMNIEVLSRLTGRAEEVHKQLDAPLSPESAVKWWSNDLENVIDERFGLDARMYVIGTAERYLRMPKSEYEVTHLLTERHKRIRRLIAMQYLGPDEITKKIASNATPPSLSSIPCTQDLPKQ